MSGRPWSLRRRLVFGSVVWTFLLMTLIGLVSVAVNSRRVRLESFTHLAFVGVILGLGIAAGFVQLWLGLAPFATLRKNLLAVRDGRERTIAGVYPLEVQPLVDDLNALLEHREQAIRRAQAKAADLAHGLKTPLAIIAHESARAAAAGDREFAAVVSHQVDRMTRQVDYHLAQARAAASSGTLGASAAVRVSVDGLVRALERLHADRGLTIAVDIAADIVVRTQREDLDEMLGNLIDNACKWCRSHVAVSAVRVRTGRAEGDDGRIAIMVDDDGPGLDVSMREAVLQRGVRADEAAPGTGIGLAIVRDVAELYGGSITLTEAPIGGLRATLRLP